MLVKFHKTGIWSLSYVEGIGMLCVACQMNNAPKPTNDIKVRNSKPNVRYSSETVCGHFASSEEKECIWML